MIELYLEKLRQRLEKSNVENIDEIILSTKSMLDEKISAGKTQKQAIDEVGDFDDVTIRYLPKKTYTKNQILLDDIVGLAPLYLLGGFSLLCMLALFFIGGYSCIIYLVKSFTVFEGAGHKAGAFITTLLFLGVIALLGYLSFRIIKLIINYTKKHLQARKEKLQSLTQDTPPTDTDN